MITAALALSLVLTVQFAMSGSHGRTTFISPAWLKLRGGDTGNIDEEAVVEVSAANFLREVFQSKVPVLIDVYADWCGPCQEIKPILEETAKLGQFKLAKINSDQNQDLVEILNVTALPTLFAVNEAMITDRAVGGLSEELLQQFIDRLVTGYGAQAQKQVTAAGFSTDYAELTEKLREYSQFSSLSFSKKEKLIKMIDAALELGGLVTEEKTQSDALKITLTYLKNAANDIRNSKYRVIKTSNKVFKEVVSLSEGCLKLLVVAGFKLKEGTVSTELEPFYELCHENKAIVNLVVQRTVDAVHAKKFAL